MTTIIPTTEAVTAVRDNMIASGAPGTKLAASNAIWAVVKHAVEDRPLATRWALRVQGVRLDVTIEKGVDGPEAVARIAK